MREKDAEIDRLDRQKTKLENDLKNMNVSESVQRVHGRVPYFPLYWLFRFSFQNLKKKCVKTTY